MFRPAPWARCGHGRLPLLRSLVHQASPLNPEPVTASCYPSPLHTVMSANHAMPASGSQDRGPLSEQEVDPIWMSSRTARQIYALGEVEKVRHARPQPPAPPPHPDGAC